MNWEWKGGAGSEAGTDCRRNRSIVLNDMRASKAALRSVAVSSAMQIQSANTEIAIASRPALVIPKSRKRSSWPQWRVRHLKHAALQLSPR
jgi:hypothetical protein